MTTNTNLLLSQLIKEFEIGEHLKVTPKKVDCAYGHCPDER